jgi:hypothetical protein
MGRVIDVQGSKAAERPCEESSEAATEEEKVSACNLSTAFDSSTISTLQAKDPGRS